MSSMTIESFPEDKPLSGLSLLLRQIMEKKNASYVHLLYELEGDTFIGSFYHSSEPSLTSSFASVVKHTIEVILNGEALAEVLVLNRAELSNHSGFADAPEYLSFIPIKMDESQSGILALGFSGSPILDPRIEDIVIEGIATLVNDAKSGCFLIEEQLSVLTKNLGRVRNPGQIAEVIIQVNSILALLSSTIICLREGIEGTEYLIYLPEKYNDQHSFSLDGLSYKVIDASTDEIFYEFLEKAKLDNSFSSLTMDRYTSVEEMHPYIASCAEKGGSRAIAYHLLQDEHLIGFWLTIPDCLRMPFSAEILEPFLSQLSTSVNNINIHSELTEKKKESEILMSLNIDLAATRDKKNLLSVIRGRLQPLIDFSHHFVCKINESEMTVSMLLNDAQSLSRFHPLYEYVKTAKSPITGNIYQQIIRSTEPLVIDLANLARQEKLPPQLLVNFESGVEKVIMVALRVDSTLQGIWTVAFTQNQPIMARHLQLIKTVSAPISISVANIRINDSLRKREEERERIMAMSFELTAIRNKKELVGTLERYLPNMFDFQMFYIFLDNYSSPEEPFLYFSKTSGLQEQSIYSDRLQMADRPLDFTGMLNSPELTVSEIGTLVTRHPDLEFLSSAFIKGAKSVVSISLRNDNRSIGMMLFFLAEGMQFPAYHHNALQVISYQISTSISDLLLNENLRRRELEKELLLILSEDIAAVRDKKQLTQVIKNRLKPNLGFAHFALGVKASDNTIVSFLADPDSKAKQHPAYNRVFKQEREQCEDFIDYINQSPYPVILDKTNAAQFDELPYVVNINFESGVKEILIAKLFDGVSIFGYCFFFFDRAGIVSKEQFSLVKGIANQFSTAIYNIKANLEIISREKESELLISLSQKTAGVRNAGQLIDLIAERLSEVFLFDQSYIGIPLEGNAALSILSSKKDNSAFEKSHDLGQNIPMVADFFRLLKTAEKPISIELNSTKWKSLSALGAKSGFQHAVICSFVNKEALIGVWIMLYKDATKVDKGSFRLMQGVSDQLSNALANILANERLKQDEMKKSILLSFSKNIATARSTRDLSNIANIEMKNVLRFDHSAILQFSNDGDHATLLTSPSKRSLDPINESRPVALVDIFGTQDLIQDDLLLTDLDISDGAGEMTPFLVGKRNQGINHIILVKLTYRAQQLGFWMLCFDKPPQLSPLTLQLVQEVAAIIATTISNIYFNDRLNKREQEKTSLLEFTQTIAGVQDRFQLRNIFNRYLKNLCLIEDISLHWFSDDKKWQSCYFWNQSAPGAIDFQSNQLAEQEAQINDEIFGLIIDSQSQQRFKTSDLAKMIDRRAYIDFLSQQHCEYIVGVPMLRGNEVVGILFVKEFDSHTADQPLFRGLCTQLVIAVTNLMASDRILQQLSQIKMYQARLEEEKVYLKQELETSHHYSEIVGESEQIKEVFRLMSQVAESDSTVLILGETGTGKELIARAIHNNSPRRNQLLVKVNCAALPANLIESELFGHEKGAFTGATERRIGKFELANGGSLFLDEIGEMPLELQVKLLRALQEREIERVGGRGTLKVDVRIITATNRNLEQQAAEGKFRSDLYFRLSTFPIHLPALRDRIVDVPELALHFLNRFSKKSGKQITTISHKAMEELMHYHWPGNIRELEHQIERSVIMADANTIKAFHLPVFNPKNHNQLLEGTQLKTIDDSERDLIIKTLKYCKGKVSGQGGAAEILGVPSTTLNAKIKRLGIKKNFSR